MLSFGPELFDQGVDEGFNRSLVVGGLWKDLLILYLLQYGTFLLAIIIRDNRVNH